MAKQQVAIGTQDPDATSDGERRFPDGTRRQAYPAGCRTAGAPDE
jgi:hypothetical protein